MEKLCECGCGELAPLARQTWTARGWERGESLRFVHGHRTRLPRTKATHCARGHAIAEVGRDSQRRCRECDRQASQRYNHTLKGVQKWQRDNAKRSIARGNRQLREAGLDG